MKQKRDKFGRFVKQDGAKSPARAQRRKNKRKAPPKKKAKRIEDYPVEWEANFDDFVWKEEGRVKAGKGIMEQIEDNGNEFVYDGEGMGLSPDDMLRLFEEFGAIPFAEVARKLHWEVEEEEEGLDTPSELMEHIEI